MKNKTETIDFVIPWVDGSDPAWQEEFIKYRPEEGCDSGENRYRDWKNLRYWFRGVEKFAPWVNTIWFVTWGHVPDWLDREDPRLRIIRHEDYIPAEYLPTFSSHPIELNFHRIPGLSEHFVYFNDDMFLIRPVKPEIFFKNGLPRDCCIETAVAQDDIRNPFAHILLNTTALVNMHYDKREVIRKNFRKWFHPSYGSNVLRNLLMFPYQEFSGFKYTHVPSAFLKSTFNRVWEEEGEVLDRVCRNRFRSIYDVNQYVMKYWQYMEGMYEPQTPGIGRFYKTGKEDRELLDAIRQQKTAMLCINDEGGSQEDFVKLRDDVIRAFQEILPERSAFELWDDKEGI